MKLIVPYKMSQPKPMIPKNIFFLLFISFFFSAHSIAQKSRWTLKTAYAHYSTNLYVGKGFQSLNKKTGNYQLELNYSILNSLETGVHFGYSKYNPFMTCQFLVYGININYSLLQQLINNDNLRFDFYFTGKLGGNYNINPIYNNNVIEYGLGAGISYYPFKRLGLFSDFSWGQYFFEDNKKFRAGLIYKLKY
jgi:hypothetical protein